MDEVLLSIERLRVAYPHHSGSGSRGSEWAVDDVSLSLKAGECIGLVGESGCGKSTIGRTLLRLLPSESTVEGQIEFAGQSVLALSPQELRQFRGECIGLVFQDPMTRLNPLMTVKDHCLETLKVHRPNLSARAAKERVLAALASVNIPEDRWAQYPHEFSGGMRQRVAIALTLLLDPKLIVADEPTTSLDVTVSAQILKELTRLCRERQMGLILISHDLALVSEHCDRVAVMYQGKIVELGPADRILQSPEHPYTQSLLRAALHLQTEAVAEPESQAQSPNQGVLLKLENLQQHYDLDSSLLARLLSKSSKSAIRAVDDINLEIFAGETLGLVGESGCGKSTLSRTILRLVRPTGGRVIFKNIDLAQLSQQEMRAYRRELQMIFQDPRACLNPMMKVGQSIAEPLLIHKLATPQEAEARAKKLFERVGLTPANDYYHRYPSDLSGGQLQRIAIARALITHPKLIICDEPVSMLDASIQAQVLDLMQDLKDEFELTYLFITHDLWVARFFCDRIAVMHRGQIVELGETESIFRNPQHAYTQKLLGAAPLLARLQT
ncbi:dipeptide ABC transporter ATP-binding protein [Altericista sp. CCNU0014]|uniref:dipeptide ABC transporter ATP-binding protein n=1 Tax=Altericista sp. CCNU0014 TaxID=3082949 RepID=UPI00384FE2D1